MKFRVPLLWCVAAFLLCAGSLMAGTASVTLTWTAPGDNGSVGWASQYDLRYALVPITDANWALATKVPNVPPPKPAGNGEIFKVTGLLPATTYYFAIKSADAKPNWSPLSNLAVKTTCPGICLVNGNVNGSLDGRVDLQDLALLTIYLTSGGLANYITICPEMANVDGSPDGAISLSDLSRLVAYLTNQTPIPPCPK